MLSGGRKLTCPLPLELAKDHAPPPLHTMPGPHETLRSSGRSTGQPGLMDPTVYTRSVEAGPPRTLWSALGAQTAGLRTEIVSVSPPQRCHCLLQGLVKTLVHLPDLIERILPLIMKCRCFPGNRPSNRGENLFSFSHTCPRSQTRRETRNILFAQ